MKHPANGPDDVDRLQAAIEAHERFVADRGRGSVSDFLAEHEEFRDLLEPLFAQARPPPQPHVEGTRVLGDFRLLGELGRGGMGVVYDAEQISLGRRVAVKVLPGRLALDPDRRARFERESRLAASLDHPGIAKVISADTDGDVIWFAMERIAGAPLDRVLRRAADTQLPSMTGGLLESAVDEVLRKHRGDDAGAEAAPEKPESTVWRRGYVDTVVRIGAQIAEALHHAHEHGVIHRDVKPGNVLLRRDGSAVLTDFGLARDLSEPSLSLTGEFLGTPSYSAPEQLAGERAAVDHRTDVFALGVTLYELLTQRRPFEASTADEVRTRILTVEPPRPRRLNPRIPPDLSAVLLAALEKDPSQRYQSAAAMAADLRAVAAGRPVQAVSVRAHKRAWRWCRRNRWATTALASMFGVVVLLLTIRAQLVHANAEQMEKAIRAGVALARAQDFHDALDALMPLERQFPGAPTQAALDELFRRHPCLASHALVSEPGERVHSGRFSSDGEWVLTVHEWPEKPQQERWQLRLWRVPAPGAAVPQLSWEWESDPGPTSTRSWMLVGRGGTAFWIKNDRTVAVGGPDRETADIAFTQNVQGLVASSVRGHFGVHLEDRVQLLDPTGRVVREWPHPSELPFSPQTILDDLLLLSRGNSGAPWIVVSAPGAEPIDIGAGLPLFNTDPDDPTRVVITTDTWVTAWRSVDGKLEPDGRRENRLPTLVSRSRLGNEGPEPDVSGTRFARLGELPLWRSNLVGARYFEAASGRSREPYIVAIEDRALRIWGSPEPHVLDPQERGLEIAVFEPTGRRLWGAGLETLAAWSFDADGVGARQQVEMPREIRDAVDEGLEPSFSGIAFDADRSILACARGDAYRSRSPGWVFVFPADELRGARSFPCSSEPGWIELSPDHRQLAVAGRDGGVELWTYDPDLRELSGGIALPARAVSAMRLSSVRYLGPRFLLASEADPISGGGLLRWDLDDPGAPPVPVAPPGVLQALRCLAVSPDSRLVATGGDDRMVRVLRVVQQAGKPQLVPAWHADHGADVLAVAFAERDGALLLASADKRGGIRLWDGETGVERGLLREAVEGVDDMILSLDFSPDGRHLAASQHGGRVLVWDMDRPRRCLEGNRECAEELLRLQGEAR